MLVSCFKIIFHTGIETLLFENNEAKTDIQRSAERTIQIRLFASLSLFDHISVVLPTTVVGCNRSLFMYSLKQGILLIKVAIILFSCEVISVNFIEQLKRFVHSILVSLAETLSLV